MKMRLRVRHGSATLYATAPAVASLMSRLDDSGSCSTARTDTSRTARQYRSRERAARIGMVAARPRSTSAQQLADLVSEFGVGLGLVAADLDEALHVGAELEDLLAGGAQLEVEPHLLELLMAELAIDEGIQLVHTVRAIHAGGPPWLVP